MSSFGALVPIFRSTKSDELWDIHLYSWLLRLPFSNNITMLLSDGLFKHSAQVQVLLQHRPFCVTTITETIATIYFQNICRFGIFTNNRAINWWVYRTILRLSRGIFIFSSYGNDIAVLEFKTTTRNKTVNATSFSVQKIVVTGKNDF